MPGLSAPAPASISDPDFAGIRARCGPCGVESGRVIRGSTKAGWRPLIWAQNRASGQHPERSTIAWAKSVPMPALLIRMPPSETESPRISGLDRSRGRHPISRAVHGRSPCESGAFGWMPIPGEISRSRATHASASERSEHEAVRARRASTSESPEPPQRRKRRLHTTALPSAEAPPKRPGICLHQVGNPYAREYIRSDRPRPLLGYRGRG